MGIGHIWFHRYVTEATLSLSPLKKTERKVTDSTFVWNTKKQPPKQPISKVKALLSLKDIVTPALQKDAS
jgi:hypothetical protein